MEVPEGREKIEVEAVAGQVGGTAWDDVCRDILGIYVIIPLCSAYGTVSVQSNAGATIHQLI